MRLSFEISGSEYYLNFTASGSASPLLPAPWRSPTSRESGTAIVPLSIRQEGNADSFQGLSSHPTPKRPMRARPNFGSKTPLLRQSELATTDRMVEGISIHRG